MKTHRAMRTGAHACLAVVLAIIPTQRASAATAEKIVQLPPFIVEETVSRPWRYARISEFEVLSCCEDRRTSEIALRLQRMQSLIGLVLPSRFRLHLDAPKALILYDELWWPAQAQEAVAAMLRSHPAAGPFFRNLSLADTDSVVVFALVSPLDHDLAGSYFTSQYIGQLLARRVPSLPAWFQVGFLQLYEQLKFNDNTLALRAARWPSVAETSWKNRPRPLLPLDGLLAENALAAHTNTEDQHTWFAQVELFVRWGIDPRDDARRTAFWEFLDRACNEPFTEAMFEECFGFGFAAAMEQLASFIPLAESRGVSWELDRTRDAGGKLALRDASKGEIARIMGEWERLEANYVRRELPDLEAKYLEQALRTLRRAYDRGDRDPRLLAVLALCEQATGERPRVRALLEEATAAKLVRPRAYFELARLRFEEEIARPAGPAGKLTLAQARAVLEPLATARQQAPSFPELYELIAEVWENCDTGPQPEILTPINEGLRLFAREAQLLYRSALAFRTHGLASEAGALVDQALRLELSDTLRAKFLRLRETLPKTTSVP